MFPKLLSTTLSLFAMVDMLPSLPCLRPAILLTEATFSSATPPLLPAKFELKVHPEFAGLASRMLMAGGSPRLGILSSKTGKIRGDGDGACLKASL
jgi:hypothetical protein